MPKRIKLGLGILLIIFLLPGCGPLGEFIRDPHVPGPSWDINLQLPLIPPSTIKMGEILEDLMEEEMPEGDIKFDFDLDPMSFDLDEMDLPDLSFSSTFSLPEFTIPELFALQEKDVFIDIEGGETETITETMDLPGFQSITVSDGDITISLTNDAMGDITATINLYNTDSGEHIGVSGPKLVPPDNTPVNFEFHLDGETLEKEIDIVMEIEASDDFSDNINIAASISQLTVIKVEGYEAGIDLDHDFSFTPADFEEGLEEIVFASGNLRVDALIPEGWGVDFSVEELRIGTKELDRIEGNTFDMSGVSLKPETDEFHVDMSLSGTDIVYDTTEDIDMEMEILELNWTSITFDTDKLDLLEDFETPQMDEELGLGEIGDLLGGLTIADGALDLLFIVSSPISSSILIEIPIEGRDDEGEILGTPATIELEIPGNADEEEVAVDVSGILGIFNQFPHSIHLGEGSVSFDPPGIVTIANDPFNLEGTISLKLSLIVPDGGASHQLDPMPVEMGELDDDMIKWIREASVNLEVENSLPIGVDLKVYLSNTDTPYDDPEAITKTFGLPETDTDENGHVIESVIDEFSVGLTAEEIDIFKDDVWAGLEVIIPNTSGADRTVTFRTTDWLKPKVWASLVVRVNPGEL